MSHGGWGDMLLSPSHPHPWAMPDVSKTPREILTTPAAILNIVDESHCDEPPNVGICPAMVGSQRGLCRDRNRKPHKRPPLVLLQVVRCFFDNDSKTSLQTLKMDDLYELGLWKTPCLPKVTMSTGGQEGKSFVIADAYYCNMANN